MSVELLIIGNDGYDSGAIVQAFPGTWGRTMGESLEYNCQEMGRPPEKGNQLMKSPFEDFKLLNALGALLGWKLFFQLAMPLQEMSSNPGTFILMICFVAILFIIGIIGLGNLLKQSIAGFYLRELEAYETRVRELLGDWEAKTFRVAENWHETRFPKYKRVGEGF